jgi:hypothetical protein
VGSRGSIEHMLKFGDDSGRAAVRAVHVNPRAELFRDIHHCGNRIDTRGRRGADGRDNAAGPLARRRVGSHRGFERFRLHAEFGVDGDLAHVLLPEAERDGSLFDGGVRMFGGVDGEIAAHSAGAAVGIDELTGGGDTVQRRYRSSVVH